MYVYIFIYAHILYVYLHILHLISYGCELYVLTPAWLVLRVQWESREWGQDVHTCCVYKYTNTTTHTHIQNTDKDIERKGIIRFGHLLLNLCIFWSLHSMYSSIEVILHALIDLRLTMSTYRLYLYICPKSRSTESSCFSTVSHDLEFVQILS